jgi:hypothetical protein
MITLGSFIELSQPLDERLYTKVAILQDEQDEINAAQTHYHQFIMWYQERFFIVMNDELINPSYIFHRRLVNFAATIIMKKDGLSSPPRFLKPRKSPVPTSITTAPR